MTRAVSLEQWRQKPVERNPAGPEVRTGQKWVVNRSAGASGGHWGLGSGLYWVFIAARRLPIVMPGQSRARVWLLWGMWDLSSLTRDQTYVPCIGRQILNYWTTKKSRVSR